MKVSNKCFALFLCLTLGLVITGCPAKDSPKRDQHYALHGEVLQKTEATGEVTLKHEEVSGLMPAMTMPFRVKDLSTFQSLRPGDKIAADLVIAGTGEDSWLEDIRLTNAGNRQKEQKALQTRLLPGERAPDIPLINQDGRTFRLSDLKGKAVLVTFIYTRCPMPNFCPRLSSQFAKIHQALAKVPEDYARTHMVTISFDPKYDTAPVLRKYGLAYLDDDASGFVHWDFATTASGDLRQLAQAFGLQYFEEDNQITHSMNIALIGPDGTIAKYWTTEWTTAELEGALRQAAHQGR